MAIWKSNWSLPILSFSLVPFKLFYPSEKGQLTLWAIARAFSNLFLIFCPASFSVLWVNSIKFLLTRSLRGSTSDSNPSKPRAEFSRWQTPDHPYQRQPCFAHMIIWIYVAFKNRKATHGRTKTWLFSIEDEIGGSLSELRSTSRSLPWWLILVFSSTNPLKYSM